LKPERTARRVRAADVIVTMGCGDACPLYPGKRYVGWEFEDPADKTLAEIRRALRCRRARRELVMGSLGQRLVAEAVGTFALVFAGCGAIMVDTQTQALGHVGVAISFGLVIIVMISALGHISGAHFNPAVTFGFALGRHFPLRHVAPYWTAQLLGGVAAALILRGSLGKIGGLGATTPSGSDSQAFLWETIMTAFLVLVILAVATDTRAQGHLAAIAIGGTVGLDAMFGGPITGASMNPARSLAPAIAGGPTNGLWIYIAAPLAGAAISVALYAYLAASKTVEGEHVTGGRTTHS
jgi:MIP family channel proteins